MPEAVTHPTAQQLTAFGQGELPEAEATAIAAHLRVCSTCRRLSDALAREGVAGRIPNLQPGTSALATVPPPHAAGTPAEAETLYSPTPGPGMPSPPVVANLPLELAQHPRYRIVRELGRGGMGVVYQAVQTLMDRLVAIKVINPSILAYPDALPRFQAEVKAAAKLDHPNIVRAYDADQVGNLHLLIMEFVEGMDLADLVHRKGPLPIAIACNFLRQAALGLQHAFEKGMVHRDIKPSNLMLTARGQVKILDFGLARLRDQPGERAGLTAAGSFMGTPEYVAPEQATDARTADIRADLYSLGCTFHFLLTGHAPFEEDTLVKTVLAQIEAEPKPLHELRADVPCELSAVAARLLAKDPAQRYQKPVELAQALMPFIKPATKPDAAAAVPPPRTTASPGTRAVTDGEGDRVKKSARPTPPKPAVRQATAKEPAPQLELAAKDTPSAHPKKSNGAGSGPPDPRTAWYRRRPVLAGIGASVLALILGLILLTGAVIKRGQVEIPSAVQQPATELSLPVVPNNGAGSGAHTELTRLTPQEALRKHVTLKAPYPQTSPGAAADRISVQHAVLDKHKSPPPKAAARTPTVAEFRKVEIHAAAPVKIPDRVVDSSEPHAIAVRKEREVYEAAVRQADERLLAAFDRELAILPKASMKPDDRLRWIDITKVEKTAFQTKGRIPWSAPMRAAMHEYVLAVLAGRPKLSQVFDRATDFYLKKNEEDKAKEISALKRELLKPKVLAVWSYTPGPNRTMRLEFLSDGTTGAPARTWTVDKDLVILKGSDGKGGFWKDTCKLSRDGKTMSGTNLLGHKKSGRLAD
jgi:serine/threonine protein kinase